MPLNHLADDITRTSGSHARSCRLCGAEITGRRRNGFCSDRCRMRANRKGEGKRIDNGCSFLMTVAEVADFLRTSPKGVYAMVERGHLPGVIRIGRRLLFRRDTLVDWLDESCASLPGGPRQ